MLSIIAAIGQNNELGTQGKFPWPSGSLVADQKWFRSHIFGKQVVIGRKTYEPIASMFVQNEVFMLTRQNAAVVQSKIHVVTGTEALRSLQEQEDEVMVLGGGQVYEQLLPHCQKLYITRVHAEFLNADTFFTSFAHQDFATTYSASYLADSQNQFDYTFNILERSGATERL